MTPLKSQEKWIKKLSYIANPEVVRWVDIEDVLTAFKVTLQFETEEYDQNGIISHTVRALKQQKKV